MMRINSFPIFEDSKDTLKNTSYDLINKEYMVENEMEVIDFDKVKVKYGRDNNIHESIKSVDAMLGTSSDLIFIEFKNGKITKDGKLDSKIRKDIIEKFYDSILIFGDITNKTVTFTRKNGIFILVYNEDKLDSKTKGEITSSKAVKNFSDNSMKNAKKEIILFGLEQIQKKMHFKNIHTYNKKEFEKFLNEQNIA